MAHKKTVPAHHKKTPAENKKHVFPTLFFESVSTKTPPSANSSHEQDRHRGARGGRIERLIWMWTGVGVVMIVIFFAWIGSINASGVLNFHALFQKNDLIKESRQSLKYYFEKQNKDRQEMSALTNVSAAASAEKINTELGADKIKQLKDKINILSATSTESLSSSSNKK